MAKSFNPFKMWGAWVGLVISGLLPIPVNSLDFSQTYQPAVQAIILAPPEVLLVALIFTVLQLTVGFLLGYGIHSIFRALRK